MSKKLDILFISSMPPDHSAGLARDYIKALRLAGHSVDFLTRYGFPGQQKDEISIYREGLSNKLRRLKKRFRFIERFRFLGFLLRKDSPIYANSENGIIITNMYEDRPPTDTGALLAAITKPYDAVVTLFWQHMLTTVSLKAIYDKLRCPIIIRSVDMFTYTGGCFYFMDCERYKSGCGCCPSLGSTDPDDQTHKNFMIKKQMYSQMNYAIGLNSWMQQFARATGLFAPERIITTSASIDESVFRVLPKQECQAALGLREDRKFLLLARYAGSHVQGKGFSYLVEAVNAFSRRLTESQRAEAALVLIGQQLEEELLSRIELHVVQLGFLSREELIRAYNACHAFLSPSIDDAGPSMVNQSIMCGTPVVCFNIGTAWDVITDGVSGYKVRLRDSQAFAEAIHRISQLTEADYQALRESTHAEAMKHNSLRAFSRMVEETYGKLQKLS